MDFDAVLKQTGTFKQFQVKVVSLAYIAVVFCALPVQQDVFVAYTPLYRCRIPSCDTNSTSYLEPFLNFTVPVDTDDSSNWSSCSYYEDKDTNSSSLELSCSAQHYDNGSTLECDHGYVYDTEVFGSSVVMDMTLTCSASYLTSFLSSSYMLGALVSAIVMGALGDIFGRKITFMLSVITFVVGGGVCSLSKSYWLLLVMRFVTALGGNGIFQCSFIMAVENVVPEHRVAVGIMINAPYALGGAIIALLAYFVRDNWRLLQLLYTLPALALLSFYWLMPESVRWLVSRGRDREAEAVVAHIASLNKTQVPPQLLTRTDKETTKPRNESVLDILRLPNMRKRCLVNFFIWPTVTLVYYGVSLNSVNLGGDIFINFVLSMLIELPSYLFVWLVLDRLGRKGTLMLTLVISGLACSASGFIQDDTQVGAIVGLSLVGKFGAAAAFSIIFVYASEIFPNEYRSVGVGACSMTGRIGGFLAPLISGLGPLVYQPLPLLIFGGLSLASGLLTLLLPETAGCTLPSTLQDSENFGRDQSHFYFLCLHDAVLDDVVLESSSSSSSTGSSSPEPTKHLTVVVTNKDGTQPIAALTKIEGVTE